MSWFHLSELIQLLSDGLIFALQIFKALFQLLVFLQHREPVLRRLDLLPARLAQFPRQALDLRAEPVGPGLRDKLRLGTPVLIPGHVCPHPAQSNTGDNGPSPLIPPSQP